MTKEAISNDYGTSETFNKLFASIASNLKIIPSENFESTIQYKTGNLVQNATNKFKNHPSIKTIISKINSSKRSSFCPVPDNGILK